MAEPSAARSLARPVARPFLVNAAVVLVVLGVLPVLWEAHFAWRLLGPLVATAFAARAAVLVWRRVFSLDGQELTPTC